MFRLKKVTLAACLLLVTGMGAAMPAGAAPGRAANSLQAGPADGTVLTPHEQIRALELQVQHVLGEVRRQQDEVLLLRRALADAESASAWLPWLLLTLAGTAAVAIWLGLRLRRQPAAQRSAPSRREHEHIQRVMSQAESELRAIEAARNAQLDAAAAQQADPSPFDPAAARAAAASAAGASTAPDMTIAQPKIVPPAPLAAPQAPAWRASSEFSLGTGVPPRPVSVEELLDLDQQADFFMALGQAQSAIDLLLAHVRASGGTNALPYFRLLEIYRHQGDEEAYERTRERFNQRFNAFAPDWAGNLAGGRSLEDYPEVMLRLQRAWPQPLRAVAELESLLLRRADLEPFDMPAYREVLMLHALVRDLPAGSLHTATTTVPKAVLTAKPPLPAMAPADVDLLLPLNEPTAEDTVPRPMVSERSSAQAMLAEWVFTRATQARLPPRADAALAPDLPLELPGVPMALDLDLSEPVPPPREFTRPPAFTDIDQRRDRRLSDFGALGDDEAPPLSRR